jgi:hypothetical protein
MLQRDLLIRRFVRLQSDRRHLREQRRMLRRQLRSIQPVWGIRCLRLRVFDS